MIGIISYGTYIPKRRVKLSEIASFWNQDSSLEKSLGVAEKSVPNLDEDAATLAIESALVALKHGQIAPEDIQSILIGSESHPYAVKPTATIVGEAIGLGNDYLALDTEFACKAATGAMLLLTGLIDSRKIKIGMVIGSDTAQAKPGDALDYTACSAAAAMILGRENVIAEIKDFVSYSSSTYDFWRRDQQKHPSHAGRFSGEPAYFAHVLTASEKLLKKTKTTSKDYDFAVFHMPNGKFPKEAAKRLMFTKEQIELGLTVEEIGNPYSASVMVGLSKVLDNAKPNQKIFVCSYGSGAGSDAFILEVTEKIIEYKKRLTTTVEKQISNKEYVTYSEVIKMNLLKGGRD